MCVKSDEQILYECYLKLSIEAETKAMKKNNVSAKNDKKLIEGINSKLSLLLVYLDETNMLTTAEILKKLISAKGKVNPRKRMRGAGFSVGWSDL